MATVEKRQTTDAIEVQKAFRALHNKLHRVRMAIHAQATEFALARCATASKISHADLSRALSGIAEAGNLAWVTPSIELPLEDESLLDQRLDDVGPLVLKAASNLAISESGDPNRITPEIIERAWDSVWNNATYRIRALGGADTRQT